MPSVEAKYHRCCHTGNIRFLPIVIGTNDLTGKDVRAVCSHIRLKLEIPAYIIVTLDHVGETKSGRRSAGTSSVAALYEVVGWNLYSTKSRLRV
jgi:hypothetical protein